MPDPRPDADHTPAGSGWRASHVVTGMVVALVASLLASGVVYAVAGYDTGLQQGRGSDLGRVAGRFAQGLDPTTDEPSIGVTALLQLPLWLGLIGVPFLAAGRSPRHLADAVGLGIRARDVPVGLAVGAAVQLVVVPLVYVPIFWVFGELDVAGPARELTSRAADTLGVVVLVLIVGIGAPVVEEIFFRGVVLGALRARLAPWPAYLASGLVFGAFHFQLVQFPALALFGVVLAWMVGHFGRLGPAIMAHLAFNLVTVLALVG